MRWPDVRSALADRGITPGVWFTYGGNLAFTPGDAAFVIAEVEGEDDYQGVLANLNQSVPHAILTNFSPFVVNGEYSRDRATPLINAGWECMTECYVGDNPQATPDRMDFTARAHLGFPRTQPTFGPYSGGGMSDYTAWMNWPGWSVYLAEYIF